MKQNLGFPDRLIRLGLGILLVAASLAVAWRSNPWLGVIPLVLGAFAIYEAAIGWCAVYALLGKNTCPVAQR